MVLRGDSEVARRCGFGIELDHHCRLVTDDPSVVSRLNHHNLWGDVVKSAAVGIRSLHMSSDQEADVRMHAERRADEGLQVR